MGFNKKFFTTGGIVASTPSAPAAFDPLQNFETVTYTGNGSTQKITGYIRKGAAFNGSTSHIDIPSTIPYTNTDFTFSCWFNLSSAFSSGFQTIIGAGDKSTGEGIIRVLLRYSSANNYTIEPVRTYSGNSYYTATSNYSAQTINAGTWYHLSYTYSATGNTAKIYLNGSLVSTTNLTTTSTDATNTGVLALGQYRDGNFFFNGKIDQVRFFNIAITDSGQIAQLAAEDYSKATKSTTDIFGNGTGVALYELDDSANDTGVYTVGQGDIDSGQSADFNGGSEAYNTSVASNLTGDYSFGFYVKFDSLPTEGGLMGIYTPNTSNGTSLAFANGNLLLNCGNSQTATSIPSSFWEVNKWYHIAVTHDNGGDVKLYVNNVLSKTLTTTSTTIQSGSTLILGRSSRTSSGSYNYVQRLDGQMDEVRIYNDVLTSTEVGYLAANDSVNIPTGNLVAHYKLDGNGNDQTNNNYSLTWSGTQLYSTNAEFPFNQYNGTPTNVNFLGMAFQPDLVWVKTRSISSGHVLRSISMDSTYTLSSNSTAVLNTAQPTGGRLQLDSNGFTVRDISNNGYGVNGSGYTQVAWCWRAAGAANTYNVLEGGTVTSDSTASGAGITAGTITTGWEVSANRDAGFSIVKYTKSGTSGTMGHGLSSAPEIIFEKRTDGAAYWNVRVNGITANNQTIYLNESTGVSTHPSLNLWTTPTASVFGYDSANATAGDYIAYCFHSVDGYQKVGSYTGTGVSGNSETTGFRPRFLMVKAAIRPSGGGSWYIFDSVRTTSNPQGQYLQANEPLQEFDGTSVFNIDFENNGFTVNGTNNEVNQSGSTYIYLAIA